MKNAEDKTNREKGGLGEGESFRLTPARKRILERAAGTELGVYEIDGPRGLAYSAKERACEYLIDWGALTPYVHGGYLITGFGRQLLGD